MAASAAMQEYLAEAYRIFYYQGSDAYISTTALADVLKVSAPAVTRMVQRLKEAGYLEHEPYRGIKLTEQGQREALMNIRHHRLVERFLVDVMGLGWHEVHDAADELGAVVSDVLVQRMAEMTGHPRRCPHGEPIPAADGSMPRVIDERLNDLNPVGAYVISRVNTHDAEMLLYFDQLGLKPGARIELLSRAPFNGPLQIRLNDQIIHLGHELSGVLRVCTQEEFDRI
jgi:DtxR family transcriptional regulator, Mn-dependent transcriptional regulator